MELLPDYSLIENLWGTYELIQGSNKFHANKKFKILIAGVSIFSERQYVHIHQ